MRQKQLKQQELSLNHHLQRQGHQVPVNSQSLHSVVGHTLPVLQTSAAHSHSPVPTTTSPSPPAPFAPAVCMPFSQHLGPQSVSSPITSSSSSTPHHHSLPASPSSSRADPQQESCPTGAGIAFPVASGSIGNLSSYSSGNFGMPSTSSFLSKAPDAPPVMSLTNGVTASSATPANQIKGLNGQSVQEAPPQRLKQINTKEFEDVVGSSPFDDALLKSIDDKQELNSVFANVSNNSSHPQNHYHGPNHHSPYNNFNPT